MPPESPPTDRTAEFVRHFSVENRRLYGYIRALIYNTADADEVYQATCTVLWSKFQEFTPGSNFFAWAASIARIEVLALRRRRGKEAKIFSDQLCERLEAALEQTIDQVERRHLALSVCIEHLTARQRELVKLRYAGQSTTKSVAQHLGRSPNAIYKSLERIHETLFACIQRQMTKGSTQP